MKHSGTDLFSVVKKDAFCAENESAVYTKQYLILELNQKKVSWFTLILIQKREESMLMAENKSEVR